MNQWLVSTCWLLGLAAASWGQTTSGDDSLGLKLGPIPDILVAHLPQLPKNAVLAEDVAIDAPAFQAGLRRHDIILNVNGEAARNAGDLLARLREGIGKKQVVSLIRQGKERTLVLTLPAADSLAKSYLKPGGPPAVTVQAQPQKDGHLSVTIYYYPDKSSKLERLNCHAPAENIEREFHDLAKQKQVPIHVQDLVEVALRRLRELNAPKQKQ